MDQKISRNEFIKFYIGNEINPNLKKFLDTNEDWKKFFNKNKESLSIGTFWHQMVPILYVSS